ncbi:MAG TPA: SDR family oxidoreductase [Solirubrobacteraceae bacterium]|nr:SDR family oxidoreductase [Solirubrobacteraceae bacterium]
MDGSVAIVTGAAGGIGSAVVALLRERGAAVVAEDIDPAVERLASDDVAPLQGDAADGDVARRAVVLAFERFGRLDVVVNNAGRFLLKPIVDTSDDEWDGLMTTNVRSVFVHCREALPRLIEGGGGAIVNVSSISGVVGLPAQGAYCATKGAIAQLTRQLAIEHASDGVRVNAVAPGAVDTNFVNAALAGAPDPQAARSDIGASHPIGRMATPEEIARIMVFLASPESSYMTGAVVMADGGYTAR